MSYYVFPQQEAVHANIKKTLAMLQEQNEEFDIGIHLLVWCTHQYFIKPIS